MTKYVEVAVYFPQVVGTFHYHLPPDLSLKLGQLVQVPFGRENRPMQGVVVGFVERPEVDATKPVTRIVDPEAVLTPAQIVLARRMTQRWLCTLAEAVALMLPPGVARLTETVYTLTPMAPPSPENLSVLERRLWQALRQRGPLRTGQLQRLFGRLPWERILERWARQGWVDVQAVLPPPRSRPRTVRAVTLAVPPEQVQAQWDHLGRPGSAAQARRQAVLQLLLARRPNPVEVGEVYAETGATAQDLRYLETRGLVRRLTQETWRDPLAEMSAAPEPPPPLTPHQQRVWEEVVRVLQETLHHGGEARPILLHGVTGSGKTEIYLRAVEWSLRQGRQALILVPEIGLATLLVRRFLARFPGQVGVLHSGLTLGQRYDTWRRARRGEIPILIGARSAVFAPMPRLGIIVVDECHADAYANQEHGPYYHAREVALDYARIVRGVVLLGSATPDVVSYHRAQQGVYHLLVLPERVAPDWRSAGSGGKMANGRGRGEEGTEQTMGGRGWTLPSGSLPHVQIVDMREVWRQGQGGPLSPALLEALEETLRQREQALLFLNRRGTVTQVVCQNCGHVFRCPRCQVPLVFHHTRQVLLCHHCGYHRRWPKTCPACGGASIAGLGWGTERLEQALRQQFPQARIYRWDRDTASTQREVDLLLEHFRRGQADILIGTQVLAKGLDLPQVTLVGVVLADIGLTLPDYRAPERTFQVLTQVVGRAGRRAKPGRAIIQTYMPEHYALRAAAAQDYEAFYREELRHRERLGYPPFARLVRLEYRALNEAQAREAAEDLAHTLRVWLQEADARATQIIGPVPCFFARRAGWYRWHILLRGPNPARWLQGRRLPPGWRIQVDPVSLL